MYAKLRRPEAFMRWVDGFYFHFLDPLESSRVQIIECMADSHKAKTPEGIHFEILAHRRRNKL